MPHYLTLDSVQVRSYSTEPLAAYLVPVSFIFNVFLLFGWIMNNNTEYHSGFLADAAHNGKAPNRLICET